MQVSVTFRHMASSEPLRSYAVEKTERLSKYLIEPIDVHWVLSVEKIRHIADATITANGAVIKAKESTQDMYSAIDMALEKLEKQVRKHKEKAKTHKASISAGASSAVVEGALPVVTGRGGRGVRGVRGVKAEKAPALTRPARTPALPEAGARPRIVKKVNQFVKPMSVEEAAMQMDLAGGSFLIFTDSTTGNINVIYRTQEGDYGLIEARTR